MALTTRGKTIAQIPKPDPLPMKREQLRQMMENAYQAGKATSRMEMISAWLKANPDHHLIPERKQRFSELASVRGTALGDCAISADMIWRGEEEWALWTVKHWLANLEPAGMAPCPF